LYIYITAFVKVTKIDLHIQDVQGAWEVKAKTFDY